MQVLVSFSSKGGPGKTLAAIHLADAFHRSGRRTLLLDLDLASPTAWRWHRVGTEEGRELVPTEAVDTRETTLGERLSKARADGVEIVVVDLGPRSDRTSLFAVIVSDLVVIPTRPSVDVWSTAGDVSRVVREANEAREAQSAPLVLARVLINDRDQRAILNDEAQDVLEAGDFKLFKTQWHHRTSFRRAIFYGSSVLDPTLERDNTKARAEVLSLFEEVQALLRGGE